MVKDSAKEVPYREDLKEKVIIEAMEAFKRHGIKSIRMDDIANLLRMSKRTLYEIFEDKETLLKECILYHQQQNQRGLEEIVRESKNVLEVILKCYKGSIEMYHRTNKKFFEEIKKYPKVYDMIMNSREKDNTVVINFLKRGVDQGIFRADINFAIIHALLREQMDLLMTSNVSKQFSFLEVYEAIIFTYLRGIATQKGAEELDDFIKEYRKEQAGVSKE
ncbi:TetR/AcrR family transcriptional regulator [Bacteroides sp. 51]|uniref:TetR/AcrR family transcriptional regulator n=1 Tax=Bacteroides sp. 51 TaxID=2302938 RepID=UPI0019403280|nr:TetR/AcrR family transcriptional regulator [Bacteroides sp. 51]